MGIGLVAGRRAVAVQGAGRRGGLFRQRPAAAVPEAGHGNPRLGRTVRAGGPQQAQIRSLGISFLPRSATGRTWLPARFSRRQQRSVVVTRPHVRDLTIPPEADPVAAPRALHAAGRTKGPGPRGKSLSAQVIGPSIPAQGATSVLRADHGPIIVAEPSQTRAWSEAAGELPATERRARRFPRRPDRGGAAPRPDAAASRTGSPRSRGWNRTTVRARTAAQRTQSRPAAKKPGRNGCGRDVLPGTSP